MVAGLALLALTGASVFQWWQVCHCNDPNGGFASTKDMAKLMAMSILGILGLIFGVRLALNAVARPPRTDGKPRYY